jgi:DNA adenine methylase
MSVAVNDRYPSPLRYPGGKGKVANFVKLILLENDLVGCEYVEPYAGGASVALSLLFEEYVTHVHINDLNESVYAFWTVVLHDCEALCTRISSTEVTTDEWHRQRATLDSRDAPDLDRAFATFFLNRTSRSGIIGGGIIGGYDQTGAWMIDARFNRADLVRRIRKIARYRNRITVTRLDAAQYIREELPTIPEVLVYFDPPYYGKGEGLYQNFYRHDEHAEIADLVADLEVPWIVSYDATPQIAALYASFPSLAYDLKYSAQDRYQGAEAMFFSPSMRLPDVVSPANIPLKTVDEVRVRARG